MITDKDDAREYGRYLWQEIKSDERKVRERALADGVPHRFVVDVLLGWYAERNLMFAEYSIEGYGDS